MSTRDERINRIVDLYKDEVDEEVVRKLANLFPAYGGTVIAKLTLDLYDSLTYNETPKGPKGKQQI